MTVVVVVVPVVVVVGAFAFVVVVAIVDAFGGDVVVGVDARPQAVAKRASATNTAIEEGILRS
jgi:hypothetical protein